MNYVKIGNTNILDLGNSSALAITDSSGSDWSAGKVNWELQPGNLGGKKIVNYGSENDLPQKIREIVEDNNLAPGILERKIGLLYGDGLQLYSYDFTEGDLQRMYIHDKEIWDWLNTWDYRRFLDMAITEFMYLKGFFCKRYLTLGSRVGPKKQIAKLEVIPNKDARLIYPPKGNRLEDVQQVLVGDIEGGATNQDLLKTYPIYSVNEPFKFGISVSYHNSYSFGHNFYSVPSYYGALRWIQRSSDIPQVVEYLTKNGISVAYHVHSPEAYWREKREFILKSNAQQNKILTDAELETELEKIKTEIFKSMTQVLSGKENAGKFIETVDFVDPQLGNEVSWKIESIDQKIKDFIDAQLKISDKADSATTSGMGLHPSLSNIILGGQLSSGSQMLYALKAHLMSDTFIPEEIILEPLNQAIAANFPGKNLKAGFYHKVMMKEDQVSPTQRMSNNV